MIIIDKLDMDNVLSLMRQQIDILTTFYDETNTFNSQEIKGETFDDIDEYVKLINAREGYTNRLKELDCEIKTYSFDENDVIVLKFRDEMKSIVRSITKVEEELNNKISTVRMELEKGFKKVNQSIAYNELAYDVPTTGAILNQSK